ncbi:MAG: mechanosensitive ion channel [Flavobacteriales bacterium]
MTLDEFLAIKILTIDKDPLTVGKLSSAVLVIFFTWLFIQVLRRIIVKKKHISQGEHGRRSSLFQLIRYLIWVIGLSLAISALGFDVTILVASSAALLVGLGFGLQNIFSDLISGLFMLFERKVKVGDVMEVDNIVGQVQEINLRTSVLLTRDGYNIVVPNHKFITDSVVNWSLQAFERRFQVSVGVSYSSDVDLVTRLLLDTIKDQHGVVTGPDKMPFVRFMDFGDSALQFDLYFWSNDVFRVEQIKSELRYKIFKSFKENNVSIPFPQRDLHIISK